MPFKPNTTQVPNDILDHWLPRLKHAELAVLLVVVRQTYGWQKNKDCISISQFVEKTGLSERSVQEAARSLVAHGVIEKRLNAAKNGRSVPSTYCFVMAEMGAVGDTTPRSEVPPTRVQSTTPTKERKKLIQNPPTPHGGGAGPDETERDEDVPIERFVREAAQTRRLKLNSFENRSALREALHEADSADFRFRVIGLLDGLPSKSSIAKPMERLLGRSRPGKSTKMPNAGPQAAQEASAASGPRLTRGEVRGRAMAAAHDEIVAEMKAKEAARLEREAASHG